MKLSAVYTKSCFAILIGMISTIFQSTPVWGQTKLSFNHFTIENGLSSGSVLSITQDKNGFLWVGTMDGLNRYDGSKVKIFRSFYKDNPLSPNVTITSLLADSSQFLWIGTNNGLYVYNLKNDSFRVFNHVASNPKSIPGNAVNTLYKDRSGNIWIGTTGGICKVIRHPVDNSFEFETVTTSFGRLKENVLSVFETTNKMFLIGTDNGVLLYSSSVPSNRQFLKGKRLATGLSVATIAEDGQKNIWLGTKGDGVIKLNEYYQKLSDYKFENGNNSLLSNIIRKIIVDRLGKIWIGTLKGLNIVESGNSDRIQVHVNDPLDEKSINFNSIYDLFEDRQGNIWVATYFGGLNCVEAIANPFVIYQNKAGQNGLSSNIVSGIVEDNKGNLWIGTEAEGLNYFNRQRNVFNRIEFNEKTKEALTSNLVKVLLQDHLNQIWVGLNRGGVNVIGSDGKVYMRFFEGRGKRSINSNDISCLMQDHLNRIWIGNDVSGINLYNFDNDEVNQFESVFENIRLSSKAVTCMVEDSKRNIWIGTRKGLNRISPDGTTFIEYKKSNKRDSLQTENIHCLAEDHEKNIWIGTYTGLFCYNPAKNRFINYTVNDGLASNKIVGIVIDDNDNLWISTSDGLNLFDKREKRFYTYDVHDGLPSNVFNFNSFYKDKRGQIFFGGYRGIVEFNPLALKRNTKAPSVVLTNLSVNGHVIDARDPAKILKADISSVREITLKYNQNSIMIDYAVMNFIKPLKNKSAYLLHGYDKNWIYTNKHNAQYTNLPSGNYLLYIKGANNDGIWNETPLVLKIKVLPPPWKTWWAYLLYFLFVSLIAAGVVYFFVSKSALKRKLHYEHMLNVRQEELHKMKMDFFTHISHEIRTPLTLIMGPVEVLLRSSALNKPAVKLLNTINVNAERLLKLTNDLLDFRKADAGYTQLKIECRNLVSFVESVSREFEEAALAKSLKYEFDATDKEIPVYFDSNHLEIVISNLLSNALKFTQEKGRIVVQVAKIGANEVEIRVIDNGIGIPKQSQGGVFTNFYQVATGGAKTTGSGIGLAFSKSLIDLHKGKLSFSSRKNSFTGENETRFVVTLSLGKDHFNDNFLIVE